MDESSYSAWTALNGLSQGTSNVNQLLPGGTGFSESPVPQQSNYGGSVGPSPLNGYPMFSSSQAGLSTPSGYADSQDQNSAQSVIGLQGRQDPGGMPQPQMPQSQEPQMNPWAITQSSSSGAFDYPLPMANPPMSPPSVGVA